MTLTERRFLIPAFSKRDPTGYTLGELVREVITLEVGHVLCRRGEMRHEGNLEALGARINALYTELDRRERRYEPPTGSNCPSC